jgi:hypothetical protein
MKTQGFTGEPTMYSEKNGRHSEIITQLGYNEQEQKVFKLLGNGNKTTYTYEPERKRLAAMYSGKGNVQLFDNRYTYDLVDNGYMYIMVTKGTYQNKGF